MGSKALREWRTSGAAALDEIEHAHAAVGGPKRGRRVATLRLTHAYVLLLSAQFQRFCRALHEEASAELVRGSGIGEPLRKVFLSALTAGRALDRGNPSPEAIGRDFRLLCPDLWGAATHLDPRNESRRRKLAMLNGWRNAIAHHDFTRRIALTERLTLGSERTWRRACDGLARSLDAVVAASLHPLVGRSPW